MLRRVLKIAGALLGVVVVLILALVGWGLTHWRRTFDAPTPAIRASTDPALIARGRYLAYGPAGCVECHTGPDDSAAVRAGATPPLAGGFVFALPVGTFRTPNLTTDSATGIGRRSDGELARMLRYGVRADGRAALPFMEFQSLSDADLTALISFLRSQPPVRRAIAPNDFTFMGKLVMAFLIKPASPETPPPATSPAESATVARGRYLAGAVAPCASCHTRRSQVSGAFLATRFAGGGEFEVEGDPTMVFVSPNLTPSRTGRITAWSEDQFVARFRAGALLPHTPMPWRAFGRMSDADVRAIYRYLRTLPPDTSDPGPSLRRRAS